MSNERLLLAAVPLLAASACSQNVYAPPSRAFPLESARTIEAGHTGVTLEASAHEEIFGPSAGAVSARVRRGLRDDLEASVEGGLARIAGAPESATDPRIVMARAGVKLNPEPDLLAVRAGLGGGYAPAGGGFVTADAGAILSGPNCYAVPSVALDGFASVPTNPRRIDVSVGPGEPRFDTPKRTLGVAGQISLKVPLERARCRAGRPPAAALLAGLSLTTLFDGETQDGFFGLGTGLELAF